MKDVNVKEKININTDATESIENLTHKISNIRKHVSEVIFGQQKVIDLIIITLLSGGHTLW